MYLVDALPQLLPTRVADIESKSFCTEVSAAFFKPCLRALKLLIFAPQLEKL
jgi:hypothetical protein